MDKNIEDVLKAMNVSEVHNLGTIGKLAKLYNQ